MVQAPNTLLFQLTNNITCSMSAVESCYDKSAAASFFGLLKRERVYRRRYITRAEARADVFDYFEAFYDPRNRRNLKMTNQTALN
jgi:putative transposase